MVLFVEISNNFIYNYIVIIFRSRYGMKNKIKIFLLFISMFLLLGTSNVRADISKENFVRIGIKDGLSSSTITAIYQDSKGYMWIGTADGLNKYNGYNVSV